MFTFRQEGGEWHLDFLHANVHNASERQLWMKEVLLEDDASTYHSFLAAGFADIRLAFTFH
jgi:hypothetical protein